MLDESSEIQEGNEPSETRQQSANLSPVRGHVVGRLEENIPPSRTPDEGVMLQAAEIDRQKTLDRFRGQVTFGLLMSCVALTISLTVAAIVTSDDEWKRIQMVIPYIITPFYTLLAVALGYYFMHGKGRS